MQPENLRILVVSDARGSLLGELVRARGAEVVVSTSVGEGAAHAGKQFFDLALVEAGADALATTEQWLGLAPGTALVVFGEADEGATSAAVRNHGASDYLAWPVTPERLALVLDAAIARSEHERTDAPPEARDLGLLGVSVQIAVLRETIARVATGDATVLVRGENGTGKEVVARAIHAQSGRRAGPFMKVHTPSLPDALLESELFGYEKGAFTGASARKPGRVELAEQGTLFLDEVAEMSLPLQAKLLRLVQDREYERLGGVRTLQANVRFIAATHRDIEHMLDSGTFREDLFYRLNVVTLWLPPLRARREDVPIIAEHYLARFKAANDRPRLVLEREAAKTLEAQRWPGNVRQLVNFIERMVVLTRGDVITQADVKRELAEQKAFATQSVLGEAAGTKSRGLSAARPAPPPPPEPVPAATDSAKLPSDVRPLREDLRRAERRALEKALAGAHDNKALAARMLGISRRTLYTKLEEHDLL